MALNAVIDPGDTAAFSLVSNYGAVDVWRQVLRGKPRRWAARAERLDPRALARTASVAGLRFIVPGDDEWPDTIDDLQNAEPLAGRGGAPIGLWLRGPGDASALFGHAVGMVGSRAATSYGQSVAGDLAAEVSLTGVTVVSGGAYGIDAAAHRGALSVDGATVAVLAGGLDQLYPTGNDGLLREIAARHLLVSEVAPGHHPTRVGFLARNRLIAAMSVGVVVVEAAQRSGARNTASWATHLGRTVMAVPGSVLSSASLTPHRLIRDGEAVLVASGQDVLADIGPLQGTLDTTVTDEGCTAWDALGDQSRAVLEAFPARAARTAAEVAVASGQDYRRTLEALGELAEQGFVEPTEGGSFRLAARRPRSQGGPPGFNHSEMRR